MVHRAPFFDDCRCFFPLGFALFSSSDPATSAPKSENMRPLQLRLQLYRLLLRCINESLKIVNLYLASLYVACIYMKHSLKAYSLVRRQ